MFDENDLQELLQLEKFAGIALVATMTARWLSLGQLN